MDSNRSQLETQQEIDHQAPLQPSTHIHPLYPPPLADYAEFDTAQKSAAPVTPAPVMFPGQTMLFMFLMMVAAAFLGCTLFYLMWLALRTIT
jgi:hypothetical protein